MMYQSLLNIVEAASDPKLKMTGDDLAPHVYEWIAALVTIYPVTPLRVVAERLRELTEVSGGGA